MNFHMCADITVTFQRCPPISGVEGTIDSHLRVLGEHERWNIDVLLRMLTELLPFVHQKALETCRSLDPYMPEKYLSESRLKLYAT
jgi:hypothetical protein